MPATKIVTIVCIAALPLTIALPRIATAQNAAATTPSASNTVLGPNDPIVFYACYIPISGVTYRIKEVDLKQKCSADHVMFSWTDGGAAGPQGPKGDPGPQGQPGPKGDPGASGFTTVSYITSITKTVQPAFTDFVAATCPAGTKVVGGGFSITKGALPEPTVLFSVPDPATNSWLVDLTNTGGAVTSVDFTAHAVCVK